MTCRPSLLWVSSGNSHHAVPNRYPVDRARRIPRIRWEISAPRGAMVAATSSCRRRSASTFSLCAGSKDVDGCARKLAGSSRWKSGPGKGQRPPGSECCVSSAGDGGHEAYTAIVWGGLLSRETVNITEAETFHPVEGNMCGTDMRGADARSWSKSPSRTKGTRRNLGDLVPDRTIARSCGPRREGEEP